MSFEDAVAASLEGQLDQIKVQVERAVDITKKIARAVYEFKDDNGEHQNAVNSLLYLGCPGHHHLIVPV